MSATGDDAPQRNLSLPLVAFAPPTVADWLYLVANRLARYLATWYEATLFYGDTEDADVIAINPRGHRQVSLSVGQNELALAGGVGYRVTKVISSNAGEVEARELAAWLEDNLLGLAGGGLHESTLSGTYPIESILQTPTGTRRSEGWETWDAGRPLDRMDQETLEDLIDGHWAAWTLRPSPAPPWAIQTEPQPDPKPPSITSALSRLIRRSQK